MRAQVKDPTAARARKRQRSSSTSPLRKIEHKKHQIHFESATPQNVSDCNSDIKDDGGVPIADGDLNRTRIEVTDIHIGQQATSGTHSSFKASGAAISCHPAQSGTAIDRTSLAPTTFEGKISVPVAASSPVAEIFSTNKLRRKNDAESLMPFTEAQSYKDMQKLHSALIANICSIVKYSKSPAAKRNCAVQDWPCQKVVSWLLFQTLNAPGAKNLGQLIQYTRSHEDWKSYMKSPALSVIEQPAPDEPIHFRRLSRPSASAPAIAHTPLASLVRYQEDILQHECLEEMRALLKPGCNGTIAADQLKTYLDRTQPANAKYGNKLHAQIAKKLGLTKGAVYRNHRWGQRLKCLCDAFGPGIITLFGSSTMKV